MFKIIPLIKSEDSYKRIKSEFNFVDFEEQITSLENLQEKMVICDYDIAIVDIRISWYEEALNLLKKSEICIVLFKGDFQDLANKLNDAINEVKIKISKLEENKGLNKKSETEIKYVYLDRPSTKNEPKIEIKEVEKIVEKIIEVEKPIIIEKEVEREVEIEVIDTATIAVVSSCSNGKSFITWNIAHGFASRGYNTSVINLDKGYSANIYYSIDKEEESALKHVSKVKNFNKILDKAYYVNENLRIFTSELCSEEELNNEEFLKILNLVQADSQITIIDCKSEINDLVKSAISYSSSILFIFDNDNMHYNLNERMLKKINGIFNPQKTIVVLNNMFYEGSELKNTIRFIKDMKLNFKDIVTIKNCGAAATDMMFTNTCPYISSKDEKFKNDMDELMNSLKSKGKKKTLFQKLFRK